MADAVVTNISQVQLFFGTIAAASLFLIIVYILNKLKGNENTRPRNEKSTNQPETKNLSTPKKNSKRVGNEKQPKKEQHKVPYSHRWLLTTLKGHSGTVLNLDFSTNGRYLASCADDRAVLLWNTRTFSAKDSKATRANIEFDYATNVKWSPDCKAFVISQATGNALQVYKVGRKDDNSFGKAQLFISFEQKHKADILCIGIACNGRYIMSCSGDTNIVIWDLKGEVLSTIDTHHVTNYYACVSPCGRFVASSGFTPDVKIWDVGFAKTGEFKEVKRAFELKGHSSGVYCFAFNSNSTRMASVSKDGTWKLWDTDIDYLRGQEPYLLITGAFASTPGCLLDLSPDGRTIAIASRHDVTIFSGLTAKEQMKFTDVHTEGISCLRFSPNGKHLFVSGGKHIRIFHNIAGYENAIDDLEEKKIAANNATMRTRLQAQVDEAKSALQEALKEIEQ